MTSRPGPTDVNPAAAVHRNARYQADHIIVRYADGDLTYAQLDDRSARLASVLADGGVEAGHRVAYLGLNSPSFLVTMLAAFRLGAIFVPVNFRLAGPELAGVLERSGATTIVCEEGHRTAVESVRETTALKRFLLVDDDPEVPTDEAPDWEHWSALLADASVNVDTRLDTRRGDVTHAAAPIFHIGALNSFLIRTLVRGGTVVLRRAFDPRVFLDDLLTHRVNSLFAVPTMLTALAQVPEVFQTRLPDLRTIVVAGAPVPPSLIQRYADHDILLQQAWGLTETAPFATHLPAERTFAKLGSAGLPMPHTEVRVVHQATGEPVAAGTRGEVVVRGPNVTPGYWENPEATAAAFDAEGWFHSGDIGYVDDDGYLYIVDRLKDMIVSGGENVYPAEVERALAGMPGISDVAVVGTADEQWGETVVAVVSLPPGTEVTLDDLREYAATRLARVQAATAAHDRGFGAAQRLGEAGQDRHPAPRDGRHLTCPPFRYERNGASPAACATPTRSTPMTSRFG